MHGVGPKDYEGEEFMDVNSEFMDNEFSEAILKKCKM
jgi:hypothetical protein